MPEQVPAPLANALRRRYTVQHELGRGGSAFVFLAHDLKHDRPVAIKVLRPEIAVLLGAERFLREIRLAAQLRHPHIMPLYDSGEASGWLYYVMPYVEGQALRHRLEHSGPLALDEALRITRDVCDALTYAHAQGVVHRDIKPENILLEPGHAVVADFGLAVAIAAAGGEKLSETGMTVGTPAYMSPEQAGDEPRIDGRSDIYSLGCVLYEMLAGTPPFTGPSAQAILARHALDPVPPLRTLRKSVPQAVERIVMKALEKVPADRFPTAAALAEALAAPSPPLTARRFLSWRVAAQLAGLVVLLGAAGWLAARGRSATLPQIRRLAVLPLENRTGDSTQGYFVDGMHEALIDQLARFGAVSVISRTSVLRYQDSVRPPASQIARQLDVEGIVEGSVWRSSDSVQVALRLIDGRSGRQLWAESYVRDLRDVLRLQGELATAIARQIRAAISPAEESRVSGARQVDPDVYTLALKGGYECWLQTEQGLRRGTLLLRQAVDADPTYAPAYARLAQCYSDQGLYQVIPPQDADALAKAAIGRALALDSALGEAYAVRGWIRLVADLDFAGPDEDYRRALELQPGSAVNLLNYSNYLTLVGRFDDAALRARQAIALDPLSPFTSINLGWSLWYAHRYDESIAQLRRTLEIQPDYWWAHMELAWNYSLQGRHEAAVAQCDTAFANAPQDDLGGACGWVYGRAGRRDKALRILERLTAESQRHWVDPFEFATVYIGLGDRDHAVQWLRRAARDHSQIVAFWRFSPQLDTLRSDPRFRELLRELRIPA